MWWEDRAVTEPSRRVYAGTTASDRAAARRARLVDAAVVVLAEGGWRALTVEAVCRGAGLNKRYFYESFAAVEDVGAALVSRTEEGILAATRPLEASGLHELDPAALSVASARYAIGGLVRYLADDPRVARAVFVELAGSAEANKLRIAMMRRIAERVAAAARDFHGIDEDRPAARVAAALLVGGTIEAFLTWLDGRLDLTVEEMIEMLAELWAVVGDRAAILPPARQSRGHS